MEQQQFKVSFSLGTKLLLSIVLLLVIVIGFLNAATIFILTDDKRAYVYQSQSTEAVLAGREFVNTVRHSLDSLRLSLVSVDPKLPPSPKQTEALQSVIDNQSDLLFSSISLVTANGVVMPHTSVANAKVLAEEHLAPTDLQLTTELIGPVLQDLLKNSYALLNLSRTGGSPLVGILMADMRFKDNPAGMPVGFGVISLKEYAKSLSGTNVALATNQGRILYASDMSQVYARAKLVEDPLFVASKKSRFSEGALEFELTGNKYLGSYVRPGLDLIIMNKTEWSKAIRSAYTLGEKFVILGLIAVGTAVIFAIFFSRTLTSPINQLYEATGEVAKGNFNIQLKPRSHDEIGALTSSFNVMSAKISDLIRESMEKVQLENELAIAATVQQTLIPPDHFQTEKLLIESHYRAASTCGGDWWGFFGVGNKFVTMIADATGHGFPSALITASARSCFSVMQKLAQEDPEFTFSPSAMLSYANRVIYDASMSSIMMTFFIGVIDFDTGKMYYSNAGHNPPWLFKKDGSSFKLNSLTAVGTRLGEQRESAAFEEKEITIGSGDVLFLYTDGLTEGKNPEGEMFGKKKVRKLVESTVPSGPKTMIEQLMTDFMAHNGEKALDDDVTIAAVAIL